MKSVSVINKLCVVFTAPTVFVATASRHLAEQEGNNITLPCSVTSDLSTTITYSWIHDNQTVLGQRVSVNGGNLVISDLQPTDAGSYRCVVHTEVTNFIDVQPRVLLSNVSILSISGMHILSAFLDLLFQNVY